MKKGIITLVITTSLITFMTVTSLAIDDHGPKVMEPILLLHELIQGK